MTAEPAAAPILVDVNKVTLRFGGVTSLENVSLQQHRGEILSVIGPNGAGKTSLFNCLSGVYTPQQGVITFNTVEGKGHSLVGEKPHDITKLGIARTFQNI